MKNRLVLTTLFLTNLAFASDGESQKSLTLAAAELQNKSTWVETVEDSEKQIMDLEKNNQIILTKLNEKLEQKLETKIEQEFAF